MYSMHVHGRAFCLECGVSWVVYMYLFFFSYPTCGCCKTWSRIDCAYSSISTVVPY